jgi:hypothetical protein
MDIFFLKKSEILRSVFTFDVVYKSEKRNVEYQIGRFLTKYIGKVLYKISDTDIKTVDKRPEFINSDIKFSISHSEDYVAVAFSEKEVGLDIEKYKERDLEKFSKYLKQDFKTQDELYNYWTNFEAKYKSKITNGYEQNFKLGEYYIGLSSLKKDEIIKFYEVRNLLRSPARLEELVLEFREISLTK